MKKILLLLLILSVMIGILSCQSKETGGTPTEAPTAAPVNTDPPVTVDPCADGHDEGEWVVDLEATKTEDGKRHLVCKHCGITIREETVYALGSGGLRYEASRDGVTCTIIGSTNNLGDELYIPRYINGYQVVSIGDYAFNRVSIKKAFIPDCVVEIGEKAFHNCTKLEEVVFGENSQLQAIQNEAFAECLNLKKIELPNGTQKIGNGAFKRCLALQNFVIPDGVTAIEPNVFSDCSGLKNVVIPNGVTSIQAYAFSRCTALKSLTLPESLTAIGGDAFSSCTNLESINLDNITSMGSFAFRNCNKLITTAMDGNLSCIQGWIVGYSKNSTMVPKLPEGCIGIADGVFYFDSSLLSVSLPNSLKYIGAYNFADCSNLTTVSFGNAVEQVGYNAFSSSSKLKNVVISDVAAWAQIDFIDDKSTPMQHGATLYLDGEPVTKLTIPNGVERIGDYSFYGCNSITEVTIPVSVTSIGKNAFSSCASLKNVYYYGTAADWNQIQIGDSDTDPDGINTTRYYYSENQPTAVGNYWRLVNGAPTPW